MPPRASLLCLVLACAFLLFATPAFAERVLLLEPTRDDPVLYEAFGRLRAELVLDDFEVLVEKAPSGGADPASIEARAQQENAFAAILLARSNNGASASICIVDRVTGKTSLQNIAIPKTADAPTLLAVRAVDLLRASLRELAPGEKPRPEILGVTTREAPPEVRRFAEKQRRFQLRAGASLYVSPALGTAVGPSLGLDFRPSERLALGVWLAGPTFGASFASTLGVAQARQEILLARAFVNLLESKPSTHFELGPILALGAYHLEADSEVDGSLASSSDDMFAFAIAGGASAQLFLGSTVSLVADASALFLTPRPVVAIFEAHSSPSSPQFLGSLSLAVSF